MNQYATSRPPTSGHNTFRDRMRYVAIAALILGPMIHAREHYPIFILLAITVIGPMSLVVGSIWLAGGFRNSRANSGKSHVNDG